MKYTALFAGLVFAVTPALADGMPNHSQMMQEMMHHGDSPNIEAGQAAFAAIGEIVALLENDPATNWSKVDIQALRDHLADMDMVTLHTQVAAEAIAGGALFTVRGGGGAGVAAQRMMLAHAPFLAAATGFTVETKATADGATWRIVSVNLADLARIRGLGFYGLLATGAHHQAHHLAIARGEMMH